MDSKTFREVALSYAAVYDQELKEELQEKQDFENWVNSLVEEGYDLSEYTWEEMYEAYIEEAPNLGTGGTAQDMINRRQAAKTKAGGTLGAGGGQAAMRKLQSQGVDARSAYAKVHSQGERNLSAAAKPPAAKQPTTAPAARPSGGAPAARPAASAPASRPSATPAARPAASSSAAKPAPAAAKPAPAKPAGSAMDQWAKANPRLAQAQKIRQQGGSRAEVNKSLYNKGTAAATSTPTVVKAGVDLFDIVRGYLLDGGYAETLEEAEWMMANLIDEEAIDIILGEEQLDEISNKTVSSALNARIANTGAAIDRENKNRTPQNVRDTVRAADKESSMRSAVAKRRARMAKEEYVDEASSRDEFTRAAIARNSGRKGGITFEPGPNWDSSANRGKGAHISPKQKEKQRRKGLRQEEYVDEASSRDEFTRAAIARNSGRKGGITFEPGPNWDSSANRGKGAHISPKQKEKQRRKGLRQEAFGSWLDEAMTNYEKNRKRAAQRAAARNDARAQGKTGAVPGVGYVTPRKERETWTDESGKTRHAKGL